MNIRKVLLLALSAVVILGGCKKKEAQEPELPTENVETPVIEEESGVEKLPEPEEEPVIENHDGEAISKLTGMWVPEKVAVKRPYAIMLNNIKYASPQSGIGEADILYEALVEGGITRLMGIYEQLSSKRIGSVRSARHYFVSFADEYDAVFVHYGETKYATSKISNLGINNLSGLTSVGNTVFYRDKSVKAPHNAFASIEGIEKGVTAKKYRTEYNENYEGHFKFYEKDTSLSGDNKVNKVTLNYSNYTSPYFTFDSKTKLYQRFQYGAPHKDYNTGEQLAFKNIIIQLVKEWNIDKNGYQTMDIENSSGKGYYITNGKAVDITWTKNEASKKMRYYDIDGNELTINPGKTFISVFPNNKNVTFEP